MHHTSRGILIGGIVFVALAVCLVAFIAGRSDVGDDDPWEKTEVAEYLTNIQEHKDGIRVAFGFGIAVDGLILLGVAAIAQNLFRDRSALLASLTFAGFVANAAVSGSADVVGIVLTFVADDYVTGGPGGLVAGDPAVLEVGRALGMTQQAFTQLSVTSFGVAELSIGALLAFAPVGGVNPPRWMGWVAMISGACGILSWGMFASSAFYVPFAINSIGTLVLFFALGGWLILNRRLAPQATATPG